MCNISVPDRLRTQRDDAVILTSAGWLCTTKETEEQGRLGEGYGDVLGQSYVWKADLPNARRIAVGDAIALWDTQKLLGVAWIDDIEAFSATRTTFVCPACSKADVRPRSRLKPRYRCGACKTAFDEPRSVQDVAQYLRANYEASWTPALRLVGRSDCKDLSNHPASQLSLQDMDMGKFRILVDSFGIEAARIKRRDAARLDGHRLATVRTRVGQGAFRSRLLTRYGPICAVSGPSPQTVLEAAHLYRYSEVGRHHDDGGIMLRRDVHRLFDIGMISVLPEESTIQIHEDLRIYPAYQGLAGTPLKVEVSNRTQKWLALHYEQYH